MSEWVWDKERRERDTTTALIHMMKLVFVVLVVVVVGSLRTWLTTIYSYNKISSSHSHIRCLKHAHAQFTISSARPIQYLHLAHWLFLSLLLPSECYFLALGWSSNRMEILKINNLVAVQWSCCRYSVPKWKQLHFKLITRVGEETERERVRGKQNFHLLLLRFLLLFGAWF